MSKQQAPPVAVVIFAGTDTREGNSRVINGLMTAKEVIESGGEVEVIFDGVGVISGVEFADSEHQVNFLYSQVKDHVTGVCKYCARSYEVQARAEELGIPLVDEFKQHPSMYTRISKGVYILTF